MHNLAYPASDVRSFFREKSHKNPATSTKTQWVPRAVLLDMEPKVINSLVRSRRHVDKVQNSGASPSTGKHDRAVPARPKFSWHYEVERTLCHQIGSGNNWALGYNVHGAEFSEAALDVVRREMECSGLIFSEISV